MPTVEGVSFIDSTGRIGLPRLRIWRAA